MESAGYGLIETMRVREGRIPFLERHLARLEHSLRALGLPRPARDVAALVTPFAGTGDAVLRRVSAELVKTERRTDLAARLGGEEFALLLPDTDSASAYLVAERMRTAIQMAFHASPLPVTMSFGIASYPDDAADGFEAGGVS